MLYIDNEGNEIREVYLEQVGRDRATITLLNERTRKAKVCIETDAPWLAVRGPDRVLLSPNGRRRLVIRVDWRQVGEGSPASATISLIADDGEETYIGVTAVPRPRDLPCVSVSGGEVIDRGELIAWHGPLAQRADTRIRHTMTVSADQGAFKGYVRSSRPWVKCWVSDQGSRARTNRIVLEPDELAHVEVLADWRNLKENVSYEASVQIVHESTGDVVGGCELRFSLNRQRRPRELVTPGSVDFGYVPGWIAANRSVMVKNDGSHPVVIGLSGLPNWVQVDLPEVLEIKPGCSEFLRVATVPPLTGHRNGTVVLAASSGSPDTRLIEIGVCAQFADRAQSGLSG